MPRPKGSLNKKGTGTGTYKNHINVMLCDYTYNWILHLMGQLGITKSEVIKRVLEERASTDPTYPRPEKKGVN